MFTNLGDSLFKKTSIPGTAEVIFVSDAYASDYQGGAELTTEALLSACPFEVFRLRSSEVTMELLQQGARKYWIFGNFANLDRALIPSICANLLYSVIEYDYKYCRYRSPEKHLDIEKVPCACQNEEMGLMVSAFYHAAKSLWWMSEKQQAHYSKLFPFLGQKVESIVLSSVFDDDFFASVKVLRERAKASPRNGWIVMGSPSWIKGTQEAIEWCQAQGHEYEVVWGLSYSEVLRKMSTAEGLVFLPKGGDTCPRMVIEAKLLGCKLHLNDHVQHKDEIWFDTDDMLDTEAYLYLSRDRFWNGIRADMEYDPSISGYTTTKDCISQDYPFRECIGSMLGFCDEVVIVDGGSTDGTWEALQEMARADSRLVIHQQKRDWSHPRFAVFDGMQKALARSICTGEFCWQMDSDEVVHQDDYDRIRRIAKFLPKDFPMIALPVIEYWGGPAKVRMDVSVWKWRLSRNVPTVTHGIPAEFRKYDESGELYSAPGCDGCFYVTSDRYQVVPHATFYTPDIDQVRARGFVDPVARAQFENWFQQSVDQLPPVYHFSWFNIPRKIRTYRDYWSRHWESLYNAKQEDTVANNMFFDKRWADVSEQDIDDLSRRLKEEMGGWVFHQKVDFSRKTPHMTLRQTPPALMSDWMARNA